MRGEDGATSSAAGAWDDQSVVRVRTDRNRWDRQARKRGYLCLMEMHDGAVVETRQALVERTAESLMEIRFKPDMVIDLQGFGEAIMAKRSIGHGQVHDVMVVLPEEAEVDIRAITMGPESIVGACKLTRRLAFVAPGLANMEMAEIHFRYHPRDYATRVFSSENEARAWLATAVEQPSLS